MAKTYEPIATTTLGSSAASYTFSSIPATYTDLRLIINGLQTGTSGNPYIPLNSDTGTNYSITVLSGNGTSATSARSTNASFIYCGITAEVRNTMIFMSTTDLMNYSNTTTYKTVLTYVSKFCATLFESLESETRRIFLKQWRCFLRRR